MTGGNKRLWCVGLSMYDLLLQPGIKSLSLKKKPKKQKNKLNTKLLRVFHYCNNHSQFSTTYKNKCCTKSRAPETRLIDLEEQSQKKLPQSCQKNYLVMSVPSKLGPTNYSLFASLLSKPGECSPYNDMTFFRSLAIIISSVHAIFFSIGQQFQVSQQSNFMTIAHVEIKLGDFSIKCKLACLTDYITAV